jgi:hypothetical protein
MKKLMPYSQARSRIKDGDVLLFPTDNGDVGSEAIEISGRSDKIHVGMAGWRNGRLFCIETRQDTGGREILLSALLPQYPGGIVVKRPITRHYDGHKAVVKAREVIGRPYGWRALHWAAMVFLPIIRWFYRASQDDNFDDGKNPFCAQHVSGALRAGGCDPLLNLADKDTTPGDLDHSAALEYRFTLSADTRGVDDD